MMTLTLSADHRVVDGAQAAVFLNDVAEEIQNPGNSLS
jgi:pyruvate/2-oxoglutarate dehydrogenase complex dihydrolipoamide acyltransferase (E2) component